VIVVLGLQSRDREAKRSGGALRRARFVGGRVVKGEARDSEFARRGGLSLNARLVEGNALGKELGVNGS
jgi:hypothetical protein